LAKGCSTWLACSPGSLERRRIADRRQHRKRLEALWGLALGTVTVEG